MEKGEHVDTRMGVGEDKAQDGSGWETGKKDTALDGKG